MSDGGILTSRRLVVVVEVVKAQFVSGDGTVDDVLCSVASVTTVESLISRPTRPSEDTATVPGEPAPRAAPDIAAS